jgi:ankyrin repeat protein
MKKSKTISVPKCTRNWFFTSDSCISIWENGLICNQWFLDQLNSFGSYSNGNVLKKKIMKVLRQIHENTDLSQLTMPELDSAFMFVQVVRNHDPILGYFSCSDIWKYDDREDGGVASPFVILLEEKADLLIASAFNEDATQFGHADASDNSEFKTYVTLTRKCTKQWLSFFGGEENSSYDKSNITELVYSMVYNHHYQFLKRFLQNTRVLAHWRESYNFNVCWDIEDFTIGHPDDVLSLGTTLLQEACEADAFQCVHLLVNFRYESNLVFNPFCTSQRKALDTGEIYTTSNGMSPVHVACWHGNIRTLQVLLDAPSFNGVDNIELINRTNDNWYLTSMQHSSRCMGITPLHAILLGDIKSQQHIRDGVQMLIEFGANVNAVSGPVAFATGKPHTDVPYSLGNGNRQCYMTPLHLATRKSDPILVQMLLENGALPNVVSGYEYKPFWRIPYRYITDPNDRSTYHLKMLHAFKICDPNNTGFVSVEDFRRIYQSHEWEVPSDSENDDDSESQAGRVIRQTGVDSNGKINYVKMMLSNRYPGAFVENESPMDYNYIRLMLHSANFDSSEIHEIISNHDGNSPIDYMKIISDKGKYPDFNHSHYCTPCTMAVRALAGNPTSKKHRKIAEMLIASITNMSTLTLKFPEPSQEYGKNNECMFHESNSKNERNRSNNVEQTYSKLVERVDKDIPDLLKLFKPVEDVKMQGTDDDAKEDEMSKLIGVVSTPAALPSQPLPDEWIAAFGSTSHSIDSTSSALPTLAASVRVILEEIGGKYIDNQLFVTSDQVSDKVLNGVIRLVVNRMKSSASAVISGSISTVRASLIKHMFSKVKYFWEFFESSRDPGKTLEEHDYGRYAGGPVVDVVSLLSCCGVTVTATMSDATTYFRDIFQDLVVELFLGTQPFFACVKLKPGHPLLEEYKETMKLVSESSIWYKILNAEELPLLFFPSICEQFVDFDFDSATPIEQTNFRKNRISMLKHGTFLTNTNEQIADFHRKVLLSCDFDDMVICFVENPYRFGEDNGNELEAIELHPFSNLTYGLSYSGIECAAIVDSFENEVNCLRDNDERIHDIERVKRVEKYMVNYRYNASWNKYLQTEKYTSSETILLMVAYLQKVSQGLLTSGLLPTDGLKQRVLKLAETLQEIETNAKTPVVKDPEGDIPIEQIMLQLADLCQLRSEYSQALVLYQHVWEREDSKSAFSKLANAAQYGIAEVHCHCGRLEEALAAFGRISGGLEGN